MTYKSCLHCRIEPAFTKMTLTLLIVLNVALPQGYLN